MITHTLHLPNRQHRKLEIPYVGDRAACPFCSHPIRPGRQCQCGVWFPPDTYTRPRPRKKTPPVFTPLHDGCFDPDPLLRDQRDELAKYRCDLDRFHDPAADQNQDADPDLEIDYIDSSLPWDD